MLGDSSGADGVHNEGAERMMVLGVCARCKQEEILQFPRTKGTRPSWCIDCARAYKRQWNWAHRSHPEWVNLDALRPLVRLALRDTSRVILAERYADRYNVSLDLALSRLAMVLGVNSRRTRLEEADRWITLLDRNLAEVGVA